MIDWKNVVAYKGFQVSKGTARGLWGWSANPSAKPLIHGYRWEKDILDLLSI
jgi:hypothetical protein